MNVPHALPKVLHGFLRGLVLIALVTLLHSAMRAQSAVDPGKPAVYLTVPTAGSLLPVAPMTLEAVAVDPMGGPLTVMDFLADGVVVARSDRSGEVFPAVIGLKVLHRAVWQDPSPGVHVLQARAVRDQQIVAKSDPVRVIVGAQPPPVDPPVDPPTPQGVSVDLTVLDPVGLESDPTDLMTVEFRRTGDVSRPLRVYFKVGGSADWNTDLKVVSGALMPEAAGEPGLSPWVQSVVIPSGSAVGKLAWVPIPDDKVEGDEVLVLAVIPKPPTVKDGPEPSDYQPGGSSAARLMIRDSVKPTPTDAPLVRLMGVQTATSEPNPRIRVLPGRILVQRTGAVGEPIRVRYAVGGSARNGEDYVLLDGDLTLGAGETEGELVVAALEDPLKEAEETVILKLIDDPAYRIDPSNSRAQVTIADTTEATVTTLTLTSPRDRESFRVGSEITLRVVAVDPAGYLPQVSFWANGQAIGNSRIDFFRAPDPGTPIEHTFTWKVAGEGAIRLEATSVDSQGRKWASEAVWVVGVPDSNASGGRLHPADNSPADHRISDVEWMSYAKYWRFGVPWTPQDGRVPIGTLTRAGFLWRSGGAYRSEALDGDSPLAWLPVEGDVVGFGNAVSSPLTLGKPYTLSTNGTPERLPTSYALVETVPLPTGSVTVTIHLGPAASTRCQAVELHLGRGVHVSGISDDGQWDPETGTLRWGPFLDDAVRAVNAVVVDADPTAFAALSGMGSFDGADRPLTTVGNKAAAATGSLAVTPRLTALQSQAQGEAKLVLVGGTQGSRLDLEVSDDMLVWRRIGNIEVHGQSLLQVDTDAAASNHRFYRVVPRTP
jgi:hypothetical protein